MPHIDLRFSIVSVLALLLVMVRPDSATAQTTPKGFAALEGHVKPGDTIFVTAPDSTETMGRLVRVSPTSLLVAVHDQEQEFFSGDVARIERRGDRLLNGTLWGATFIALKVAGASGATCSPDCAKVVTLGALLGAGIGAPFGALFDALHRGRTVVYQADPNPSVIVVPLLGPDQHGVVVSFRYSGSRH